MNTQKTWLTIHFYQGDAEIEATLNYKTKGFTLSHSSNDHSVTFGNDGDSIKDAIDRAKCVNAALKFIKQELFTEETPQP
jgi:hypothetical protein